MKKNVKFLLSLCTALFCGAVFSQNVLDGPYIKENSPKRRVIPYTHLREADVMWTKRIWRVIDLREKINQPFYFPTQPTNSRKALIDVIHDALDAGFLTAYGNPVFDDEFKVPMTISEVHALFEKVDTLNKPLLDDPDMCSTGATMRKAELTTMSSGKGNSAVISARKAMFTTGIFLNTKRDSTPSLNQSASRPRCRTGNQICGIFKNRILIQSQTKLPHYNQSLGHSPLRA